MDTHNSTNTTDAPLEQSVPPPDGPPPASLIAARSPLGVVVDGADASVEASLDASQVESPNMSAEEPRAVPLEHHLIADSQRRTLQHFEIIKQLGEGSFSTVMLATERATGRRCAIKILDKAHIVKERKVKYVKLEKDTLGRLRHPFVVKLFGTLQDANSLCMRKYFILELGENGDLLDYIKKLGGLTVECARFYAAEILLAIEYLHSEGVLHRDLKPENILLDADMHIRLTDFGSVRDFKAEPPTATASSAVTSDDDDDDNRGPGNVQDDAKNDELGPRARSFVGTAAYVSPELLIDKFTCKASDYWSFGCMLFHMLTGRPPFRASNDYQIFKRIERLDYTFPEDDAAAALPSTSMTGATPPPAIDAAARDLITKLLVRDPRARPTAAEMKRHPFFAGVEWEKFATWVPPPLVPGTSPVVAHDDCDVVGDAAGALEKLNVDNGAAGSEREHLLAEQRATSKWSTFLYKDELIIYTGVVTKTKGIFAPIPKRRQLILTDRPRLLYIDPEAMVEKGEVPWSDMDGALLPLKKSETGFHVQTPGRTFYMEAVYPPSADAWISNIRRVRAMVAERKKPRE